MNKWAIIGVLFSGLAIGCGGDDAAVSKSGGKAAKASAKQDAKTGATATATASASAAPADDVEAKTDDGGATAAASTSDCEGLDDYSDFVDDYIKLVEDGDMTKAVTLMSKAESAGEGLAKMDPTSDCFREYMAINKKMTDAAMRMNGASAADMKEIDDLHKETEKAMDTFGCIETCQKKSDPMDQLTCLQGCQ